MKLLGYIFPAEGSVLCARHATDVHDQGIDLSEVSVIYSHTTAHIDMVCAVPRCGIILKKNCTDGCGTNWYDHYLYYNDASDADFALKLVRVEYDEDAEMDDEQLSEYAYAIAFTTDNELSDEQAEALFAAITPDAYDLNIESDDEDNIDVDDDDDPLIGLPKVFTSRERAMAMHAVEDPLTLLYIERLERVAVAAAAYHARSLSNNCHGEPKLAHSLYEALTAVNFMKE